ncbi:DUF1566 domain-containing protein [Desulfonatronum sp. SC1]|uniref:Lcl C-terminal domain-containing protein n=1 Tax=Desulfonatronum sp. SC1 TaxID=2109626 RepID=UPI0013048782|nr:DUF1566 domain-containing protein [Desulfonatronum sp. SC1]
MRKTWRKLYGTAAMVFLLCLTGLIMSATAFAQQCVDNGDGTVTDKANRLVWQKETAGPMDWNAAMSYAQSRPQGGYSDWRLPTKQELTGLFNSPCKDLLTVLKDPYWSSTTETNAISRLVAWLVHFRDGQSDLIWTEYSVYYARGVRTAR